MKLITVQVFDNPIDMHVLKSKLESEGIHCYIFDEHTVAINPLMSQGVGGIKLKVDESDSDKALLILQEIQAVATLDDDGKAMVCPNCGSTDLYANFKSMKGTKGILSMVVMFFFVVFPFYYKNVYKCKNCDTEFK
ncbi:DUF2007 domain-containing protein [Flavobacterium sp. SM2513]|uniref:putative signal transducing protein n=1 Tax=Flavobacterium sp. SM2513 TaxID=3424766 RepID=UPI003D7FB2C8